MVTLDLQVLGIAGIIIGAVMWIVVLLLRRLPARTQILAQSTLAFPSPADPGVLTGAVFIVQAGGRVVYINQEARERFEIAEGDPNLESMARRARPAESFFGLCAQEGQARFALQGSFIEGRSYWIPYPGNPALLVTLHMPAGTADTASGSISKEGNVAGALPGKAHQTDLASHVITELDRALSTSPGLEETIETILESIEGLIPADYGANELAQLTLWEEETQQFIPYALVGLPGIDRRLEKTTQRYIRSHSGTVSSYLVSHQAPGATPLLTGDSSAIPGLENLRVKSFLGTSLRLAGKLVGTLELTSQSKDAFTQNDLQKLSFYAGPATLMLKNALLLQKEQQQHSKITGLVKLAQEVVVPSPASFGPEGSPAPEYPSGPGFQDLYQALVEIIQPLLEVESLGIWIWDAPNRRLEAQQPFIGFSSEFTSLYHVAVPSGELADRLLVSKEVIVTPDAVQDQRFQALGLDHPAQAAGIHQAALAPLPALGAEAALLGYLQAADKRDGTPFDQEDQRLLYILSGQVAMILEHAILSGQVTQMTRQDTFRRAVTELVQCAPTAEGILPSFLRELTRHYHCECALLFLPAGHGSEGNGRTAYQVHEASLLGVPVETARRLSIPGPGEAGWSTDGMQSGQAQADPALPQAYQPLVGTLQLQSIVRYPLFTRGRLVGELWLGSQGEHHFSPGTLEDLGPTAVLLAGAIDQAALSAEVENPEKEALQARAIQKLRQQAGWYRAGMGIAEVIAQAPFRSYAQDRPISELRAELYQALGNELMDRMGVAAVLVAEPGANGPRLVQSMGDIPSGANLEALLGQRNPLRSIFQEPEPARAGTGIISSARTKNEILVDDIETSPTWRQSSLLQTLKTRSFFCFAIPGEIQGMTSQDSTTLTPGAAVLAVHTDPLPPPLDDEDAGHLQGILSILARQAGIALHTLSLLTETRRRLSEVNILLDFSRQLGSLDPASILTILVESTRKLVPAAQAGVVLLDQGQAIPRKPQEQGSLAPQAAEGYSDNQAILEIQYHTGETLLGRSFSQGSPLRQDEVDFARHYHFDAGDLLRYRDATRGRLPVSALLIPIGGAAPQGILLLENFSTPAAFTAEDQALITSLAQQTALTLENAQARSAAETAKAYAEELYRSARARAAQLEALTGVAATMTSSLSTADLINTLLDQARSILPYDTGTLWIRSRVREEDRLTIRAVRGFDEAESWDAEGIPPAAARTAAEERVGLSVVVSESLLLREMIATGKPILAPDVRQDTRFPSLVEPRYLSWLGIPLISKGEVAGVIALEKTEPAFYTTEDIQAVTAFAGQASVALENAHLYEESVARLNELDRRSQRLALLHRLSTELSSSLDATYILQLTIQELLLAVNGSGGSAFLFDTAGEILLQAESPQMTPELPVLAPADPIFDHLRETMGMLVIKDLALGLWEAAPGADASQPSPLAAYLAERQARSVLILPLATGYGTGSSSGSDLHGLLFIHHRLPNQFTPEEVELARTISNQAAVAVQNAALFQETQWLFAETRQRSAELATLYDLGVSIAQVLDQQKLIDITFENIQHLMQVDAVGLVLVDPLPPGQESLDGSEVPAEPGLTATALEKGGRIGPIPLPRTGRSFSEWVLATGQPLLIGDTQRDQVPKIGDLPVSGYTVGASARSWLGVPLVVRGGVSGVLAAQSETPDHFQDTHLRLLGQIGNQLAVALDNARLFTTVQGYAAELETRVEERTAQLAREHQRTQTLLGTITELSTSLDMDIVLNRTLALINETIGAGQSLIMLLVPGEPALYLRATLGYPFPTPKGGQPTSLKPDEGLSGWTISHRQPDLVGDLWADPRWTEPTLLRAGQGTGESGKAAPGKTGSLAYLAKTAPLGSSAAARLPGDALRPHRSAIAVPLMMGEETLGALLLFHDQPDHFSASQLDLVQATAKQIAVAINNAQLYGLIRDQAERLGDMLRQQHIETSRSQAILEAVADGVLVTDAHQGAAAGGTITLFNASAERILGLRREDVIDRSLESFLGLFGSAGQAWMDTIRRWSEDPATIESADPDYTYTEQIELEDLQSEHGTRTVSVHLSPVLLRNDFLGTVSTFRDVTHQVVLDRLKSEFVATVSHELRTPMTSIKGYVEILLMGAAGNLTEQQSHYLEVVKTNTERLAVLVNDLLDISRIEAGRVTLSLQAIDLRLLAGEASADIERRSQEEGKDMQVDLELPNNLPRVLGDSERVRQILDNLLENAYAYTPPGGGITTRLSLAGEEVQVDVQDSGIGIHPADQARIFERFYRGENALVLATSGTGLGLSIVRHLVEMHQGRIWMKSSGIPGEGSTFSFTLPVYRTE